MFTKLCVFLTVIGLCISLPRRYFNEYNLKAEISIYKTPDCMIGDDEYRTLNKKHKGTGKNGRKNSKIGLDYGIFEYSKLDQMDDTDIGDKSEESEFHPNPYMYVGYGAAHGDIMDSYIPQDLRNQRKNAGTFQSRNKFTTHLGFGTSNANNNNAKCISQCVFNNMDIIEENGLPSEMFMVKWAERKIRNDRKRFLATKDIGRCFASVPDYVKQDGCDFSKFISDCLKLNLDDE